MVDDDDPEDTPLETPVAKKASGSFRLNLGEARCARPDCAHRRDIHRTHGGGSHRHECGVQGCTCPEFVVGGPDYETLPDTLPADSSTPPPKGE